MQSEPSDLPRILSTVIPVFNEVESIESLYSELDQVARSQGYDLEIIFVDDGSSDGSWEPIRRLAAADPRVTGIRFRRNFGKAAAPMPVLKRPVANW